MGTIKKGELRLLRGRPRLGDSRDEQLSGLAGDVVATVAREQTFDSAHLMAEQFNGGLIVEEGEMPGQWALVFGPGALNDSMA